MTEAVKAHYGIGQVGRSLRHFVIGKGFKIVSTFVVLILLARALPENQYAAYIAMQALILFSSVFSTLGTEQVLARFIPECRSTGEDRMAYRLLIVGTLLRGIILAGLALVAWFNQAWIAATFGFAQWQWLLPVALAVGAFRLTSLTMSMSMESLLWQREAQYSLAGGGVARLIGTSIAYALGVLDLKTALLIELAAEFLIMGMLIFRATRRWRADPDRNQGSQTWFANNRRRIARFGLWSWVVDLAGIFYGSAPSRIVAATYMPAPAFAAFGFADTQANLGRRFMPVRLLIGLIRPVFLSRFAAHGDFNQLVQLSNMLFRLNMVMFAFPIVLLIVVGTPIFDWMTAGKYGSAAILLAGFLVILILEGLKFLFSLLTQAVEKTEIMLVANLLASASLVLAYVLFPVIGVWAVIFASIVGVSLAILLAAFILNRHGYAFSMDWVLCFRVVISSLIATALGMGVLHLFGNTVGMYFAAGAVSLVTLCVLMGVVLRPFTAEEIVSMRKLLSSSTQKNSPIAASGE